MKYIVSENLEKDDLLRAGKARLDAENIAIKLGYKKLSIKTVRSIRYKKWQKPIQAYLYFKNYLVWNNTLKHLHSGDVVIIQLNLFNTTLNFHKIIKKYSEKINFVLLIHDIESIRFIGDSSKSQRYMKRVHKYETSVLDNSYRIIAHNEQMKNELVKHGIKAEKIINLQIFDYLDNDNQKAKCDKASGVIIAGNLKPNKAPYIKDLRKIKEDFELYGLGFNDSYKAKNIHYHGSFSPDELIPNLEGSFGLIWDGNSIETCSGFTGNYLRYNNPHKTSLYLSAGLPVIIWKEAALADFIEKNKVGFSVGSLKEIPEKLQKISEKEYRKMQGNTEKIAKKLKSGYYLTEAIKKVEK